MLTQTQSLQKQMRDADLLVSKAHARVAELQQALLIAQAAEKVATQRAFAIGNIYAAHIANRE